MPAAFLYFEDPVNFANLVTIQGAHTLDLALATVGGLADLSALATTQYPEIRAGDSSEPRRRITFDHLLLQGRLSAGAALAVAVAGGRPASATPARLEIVGDAGVLALEGGAPRGVQSGRLRLTLNGAPQLADEGELACLPDAAANVGGVYAALRDDIRDSTTTVAGFDHAAALTCLVTDLLQSSETGYRQGAAGGRASARSWSATAGA